MKNKHRFPYEWTLKDADIYKRQRELYLVVLLVVVVLLWVINLQDLMYWM